MAQKQGDFSLLLPVYHGDSAEFLQAALHSSITAQELLPGEVVLVQDGPISGAVNAVIADWQQSSPVPFKHIKLATNQGLAAALNQGLAECTFDTVARMDADDVAMPNRFAKQLAQFQKQGLQLLGTGMVEFEQHPEQHTGTRVPPAGMANILKHARSHNPFNHPTVMYSKQAVISAGGYQEMGSMEDYWLFARMLAAGVAADNIAEPLLKYRVGAGVYKRRGGLKTAYTELRIQRALLRIGLITRGEFVRNSVIKGIYRLLPAQLKKIIFGRFVAQGLPGEKR